MTKIKTVDLNSKNPKDILIEKLKNETPFIFTEGKIDFDKLKLTLGEEIDTGKEKYGMSWPGKAKCFQIIQDKTTGTLKPTREKSVDFDTTKNLFIEGDNLEVLKILQKSYFEKIKMIYIDPPYNTGKDFVYKDKFGQQLEEYLKLTNQVDTEGKKLSTNTDSDGRYHSNWINMMYPRLYLARNLLKEEGVIFISIDDNEVDNLKKICNEIFGEENFIDIFSWVRTRTPAALSKKTKKIVEYLICYQKSDKLDSLKGIKKPVQSSNPLLNQTNKISTLILPSGIETSIKDKKLLPGIYGTENYIVELLEKTEVKNGQFILPIKLKSKFRWTQEYLENQIKEGVKINIPTERLIPNYEKEDYGREALPNIIDKSVGVGTNEDASRELLVLFDNLQAFDYPKPVSLIKYIINSGTILHENDIVLDFFAGSGTTAHAVLELNKEDNGNRTFICVQLPEATAEDSEALKAGYKNICEIGEERIRRVIKKIKEDQISQQLSANNKQDLGFKVFKLDRSNFKVWNGFSKDIQTTLINHVEQIKKLTDKEATLYELLLKEGFSLTEDIKELQISDKLVYSINDNQLLICLEDKLNLDLFKEIKKLNPTTVIVLDKGFNENDQLKTNAVELMTKVDNDTSKKEYILKTI